MFKAPLKSICEYIWIGGDGEIRSKTKVIPGFHYPNDITFFPEWNYDGSSTGQADSNGNTEVILNPCAYFKDPLTTTKNNPQKNIVKKNKEGIFPSFFLDFFPIMKFWNY